MSASASLTRLRDFIAIPSVNPMGRANCDARVVGERRYAEAVAHELSRLAIDSVLVGEGERISVVAEVTQSGLRDSVLVASHLDTVPVDTMEIDPFDPFVKAGRVYGRGSCDTKAGLAAAITALERVLARGRLGRNVILVGEADEELGSLGIEQVVEHLGARRPSFAVATEPTDLKLVTAHKGAAVAQVVACGRACHSSNPTLGSNAIVSLARAVVALEAHARELALRRHATLGPATLSVGLISGGQSHNIVPDRAQLTLDRRVLPGETEAGLRRELQNVLAAAGLEQVSVEALHLGKHPLHLAPTHPAFEACRRAAAAAGTPVQAAHVAFATDAGHLADAGVPCLVFGPGSIDQAHTAAEYCPLQELERATAWFERLFEAA